MSTTMSCTPEHHVALKTDPQRLRRETPAQGKPQLFDGEILFYFRDCSKCLSTLAIEPDVEMAAREG